MGAGREGEALAPSLPRTPMDPPRAVAVLLILLPVLAPVASGVPFVVLHGWGFACLVSILLLLVLDQVHSLWLAVPGVRAGIGDECGNDGLSSFTKMLGEWSGSKGYCM